MPLPSHQTRSNNITRKSSPSSLNPHNGGIHGRAHAHPPTAAPTSPSNSSCSSSQRHKKDTSRQPSRAASPYQDISVSDWNATVALLRSNPEQAVLPTCDENNKYSTTILHKALSSKAIDGTSRLNICQEVLRVNPNLAAIKNYHGSLPLHIAVRNNVKMDGNIKEQIIDALIKAYPAALTMGDAFSHTPLHVACDKWCSPKEIKLLVDNGPEATNMRDEKGYLPIHIACSRRCTAETLEVLLNANPDSIDATTNDGDTPLAVVMVSTTKKHTNKELMNILNERIARRRRGSVDGPGSSAKRALAPPHDVVDLSTGGPNTEESEEEEEEERANNANAKRRRSSGSPSPHVPPSNDDGDRGEESGAEGAAPNGPIDLRAVAASARRQQQLFLDPRVHFSHLQQIHPQFSRLAAAPHGLPVAYPAIPMHHQDPSLLEYEYILELEAARRAEESILLRQQNAQVMQEIRERQEWQSLRLEQSKIEKCKLMEEIDALKVMMSMEGEEGSKIKHEIKETRSKLSQSERNKMKSLNDLQKTHAANLKALENECQQKWDAVKQTHENKLRQITQESQDRIDTINKKSNEFLTIYDHDIREMNKNLDNLKNTLSLTRDIQNKKMKHCDEHYRREIAKTAATYHDQLAQNRSFYVSRIEQLENQLTKAREMCLMRERQELERMVTRGLTKVSDKADVAAFHMIRFLKGDVGRLENHIEKLRTAEEDISGRVVEKDE